MAGGQTDAMHMDDTQKDERMIARVGSALGKPICDALKDERVIEIMLNSDGVLWIERRDKGIFRLDVMDQGVAKRIISYVADSLNTTVTPERPIVEGELILDGSRFYSIGGSEQWQPIHTQRLEIHVETFCNDFSLLKILFGSEHPQAAFELGGKCCLDHQEIVLCFLLSASIRHWSILSCEVRSCKQSAVLTHNPTKYTYFNLC